MNELFEKNNVDILENYCSTEDLLADIQEIITASQKQAYHAVDVVLCMRNWMIGKRIAEDELKGEDRADYGINLIKKLSKELTATNGKGYDRSNLYHCLSFYKTFPQIVDTVSRQSFIRLSWSHYLILLRVFDPEARAWYEQEAYEQTWSVRTLKRNVETQYYYRLLSSRGTGKQKVTEEMQEKTAEFQSDKLAYIKNPIIAEFLGLSYNVDFSESLLESRIISNLQQFLMELGKGYAFVARQQHIKTEQEDYFIDLVFYNYILKCFVLFDLKVGKITHQDVGQMDMYVRMYDELKRGEGDNPTIGIVLCTETDADIARYSILHGNEQLFVTKYKNYLPSEEQLRAEIEAQKQIFALQQYGEKKSDDESDK